MRKHRFLQDKDGGRARRGLLVLVGCAFVWAVLIWLIIRLL